MRLNSGLASSTSVSCTTFNILAPIYKRVDQLNQSIRESHFRTLWFTRNQNILDLLLHHRSSVICLQEVWVANEELVNMYHDRLATAGYTIFQLPRTNRRGDGLLTAIHKDYFEIVNYRELLFNDFGDRVAQLLHVKSLVPSPSFDGKQEFLIVNTHLLFPHDSSLSIARLHQVYKILQYLEAYQKENKLTHMPIILCGDWNGSKRGHVYKFLRSQGFISSYDAAHQYTDSDAHKWVSHRNHRGNICGVDFIWLCNPTSSNSRKPLRTSWVEAVFSIIKYQLQKASIADDKAFAFLGGNKQSDSLTYSGFCQALQKVNPTGIPHGLSFQETKELWARADLDGNGVFDYEKLNKTWNMRMVDQSEKCRESVMESKKEEEEAVGLKVERAVLFPQETERGLWPEDYSLSDHACLTVQFSPVKLLCTL